MGVKEVEDPRRFGVVVQREDGSIEKLVEKPQEPVSNLAIVGIYYIKNSDSLGKNLQRLMDEEIKTRGEYQLTDALQLMLEDGEKMETFPVEGWHDCGKKETMLATNQFLLERYKNKYKIDGNIINEPSFIGENVKLENSIIGPYASIADGSEVKDSIIKEYNYK